MIRGEVKVMVKIHMMKAYEGDFIWLSNVEYFCIMGLNMYVMSIS